MKKLLMLTAMFGFVACGGADKADEKNDETQTPEVEVVEEVSEEAEQASVSVAEPVAAEPVKVDMTQVRAADPQKQLQVAGKKTVEDELQAVKATAKKADVDGVINTAELQVIDATGQAITRVDAAAKEVSKEVDKAAMKVNNQLTVKE